MAEELDRSSTGEPVLDTAVPMEKDRFVPAANTMPVDTSLEKEPATSSVIQDQGTLDAEFPQNPDSNLSQDVKPPRDAVDPSYFDTSKFPLSCVWPRIKASVKANMAGNMIAHCGSCRGEIGVDGRAGFEPPSGFVSGPPLIGFKDGYVFPCGHIHCFNCVGEVGGMESPQCKVCGLDLRYKFCHYKHHAIGAFPLPNGRNLVWIGEVPLVKGETDYRGRVLETGKIVPVKCFRCTREQASVDLARDFATISHIPASRNPVDIGNDGGSAHDNKINTNVEHKRFGIQPGSECWNWDGNWMLPLQERGVKFWTWDTPWNHGERAR